MALKLMYITNHPEVAKIAQSAGVDRIFVDLETIGKQERQGGMDTVQSKHSIDDIVAIKKVLVASKLLVRSNPIHGNSKEEIDNIVKNGADIIMLPFFKTIAEIKKFINFVGGRAKTCLLAETPESVEILDEILETQDVDEIYIGLNDLHLGYGKKFMFELLADGTVESMATKIKGKNIPFGFGGVSYIGGGTLSAERIITEHYRLGSRSVILSRSFCNAEKEGIEAARKIFPTEVKKIRDFEKSLSDFCEKDYENNKIQVKNAVTEIVKRLNERDE